jgi:hypothetical protein
VTGTTERILDCRQGSARFLISGALSAFAAFSALSLGALNLLASMTADQRGRY